MGTIKDIKERRVEPGWRDKGSAMHGEGASDHPAPATPSTEDYSEFGTIPTFQPLIQAPAIDPPPAASADALRDFELLRKLGAGSCGQVYLARQRSLGRLVALKITADRGQEARALASLQHDHIVQVFSETLDHQRNQRLLCMQYVPGASMSCILRALAREPAAMHNGRALIDALDAACSDSVALDAAGLREREFLIGCDAIEAACWIGARLAEALAHTHGQGILHRDIKPANILFNRYGRPMLADFNLAHHRQRGNEGGAFGGTLSYMAPEHLDAFNAEDATSPDAVDERSDLYSLGVVLFELLTGGLPFPPAPAGLGMNETLRHLAAGRRASVPSPRQLNPHVPESLDRVIRRCLEPEPAGRYQTAAELMRVLEGCRELNDIGKQLPDAGPLTRAAQRRPRFVAVFLPLLPHIVGALVVFSYTALWIASHPGKEELQRVFMELALGYSVVIFPITGILAYRMIRPMWRTMLLVESSTEVSRDEAAAMRGRLLQAPYWGTLLSSLGWLPGAVLLPLCMLLLAPNAAGWDVFLHYFMSFTIAGLIALAYTEFAAQFLVVRVVYPQLWIDPESPRHRAGIELAPLRRRLRSFQVMACLIPLTAGVALLIGLLNAGPEQRASTLFQLFLVLVLVLIVLGMAACWAAILIGSWLHRTIAAFTGGRGEESRLWSGSCR